MSPSATYPDFSEYRHSLLPCIWDSAGYPVRGEPFYWAGRPELVEAVPELVVGWGPVCAEGGGDDSAEETLRLLEEAPRRKVIRSYPVCDVCGLLPAEGSACELLVRSDCNYVLPVVVRHKIRVHGYRLPAVVVAALRAPERFADRKKTEIRGFWHLITPEEVRPSDLDGLPLPPDCVIHFGEWSETTFRITATLGPFERTWVLPRNQLVTIAQARHGIETMISRFREELQRLQRLLPGELPAGPIVI